MRHLRRSYYDAFSRVYDRFVALHSTDRQGVVRRYLSDLVPVKTGERILDICTGTGALLPYLREKVGLSGSVVGVDFSRGMLSANLKRTNGLANIHLVEADVASLPFAPESFDAATCSHAFYELKGEAQELALSEIVRVLKPGKAFLMMEHDLPRSTFGAGNVLHPHGFHGGKEGSLGSQARKKHARKSLQMRRKGGKPLRTIQDHDLLEVIRW